MNNVPNEFNKSKRFAKKKFPRGTKKFHKIHPTGMRKAHVVCSKYPFGGDVRPKVAYLRRLLRSHVGEDWDEVYSKLLSKSDRRTFSVHILKEYIGYIVEINTHFDEDGQIVNHWGKDCSVNNASFPIFYVHPETNVLMISEAKRRIKRKEEREKVFEIDKKFYIKQDGIWWRVQMTELNYWSQHFITTDVFIGKKLSEIRGSEYDFFKNLPMMKIKLKEQYGKSPNGELWYCTKRESANSKEILKLKKMIGENNEN